MRLLRYAAVAALMAIGVLVAAAPASYAARSAGSGGGSTAFASPSTAAPGQRVLFVADCSPAAGMGSATLFGTTLGLPSRIPMNPGKGQSFDFSISVTLPRSIAAGTYHPDIDCPGATSATATLHVTRFPSGGAATGDGATATTSNGMLAMAGLALIGVGALAGGFALHRRSTRDRG
ncbi:MAG TPA: hypothetical protein VFV41_00435 [Streptosporangiaceae bacterium]|nr:hypothetical protein [Streptosporangiaceae bacterium]